MDVKKIIEKVCDYRYDNVDTLLTNEIARIQKMRVFAKIVRMAEMLSDEMKDNIGETIDFEIGYETDRYPQTTTVFYNVGSQKYQRMQVEYGSELMELLQYIEGQSSGSLVIDHAFKERIIGLILGEKLLEKYLETYYERYKY